MKWRWSLRGKPLTREGRHMKALFALLTALTLLTVAPLGAAWAGAVHTGKGTVLSVDSKGRQLVMTEEPEGIHVLLLNSATKVVDEMGSPLAAPALQPGDLIREECQAVGDGTFAAKQIHRVRPAWMETASPEQ